MKNGNTKNTYQQIAELSGVSVSTVSRVVNERKLVNAETYENVVAAIRQLGCEQLLESKVKKTGSRSLIMLAIPEVGNPFFTKIIQGIKTTSRNRNFDFILYDSVISTSTVSDFLRVLRRTKVAGVIMLQLLEAKTLERISSIVPVVQCSEFNPECNLSYVTIDNFKAATMATDYILSCGCRRIAIINGDPASLYANERERGYLQALAKNGLEADPSLIINLSETSFAIYISAITNIIEQENPPDAFFCTSDIAAAAAIKVCMSHGLSIPGDIQIVGFDNVDITIMTTPTITTVNQPCFDMGVTAFDLLYNKLSNPESPPKQVVFNTELIIRESTLNSTLHPE